MEILSRQFTMMIASLLTKVTLFEKRRSKADLYKEGQS